jgi:penicillin-binding protein 1A
MRRRSRGGTRFLIVALGIAVGAIVVATIAGVGFVLDVARSAKPLSELRPLLGAGPSQFYAADGTPLGYVHSDIARTPVGWEQIPADLRNATVAIEDQRFYKHHGVDYTGIFRAAVKDLLSGAAVQGASTITMQLMRNLYLGGDQHTIKQKIIEAKYALEYEKKHSKRYILTGYLNSVPYGTLGGQTAIGVQAGARMFFDKPADQLDLAQSALLAGLPQAPSQYNPFNAPEAARSRRNEVLAKMAELHYISTAQATEAERAPLEVHAGYFYSQRREPFFFEYVREQLVHRYGHRVVEEGGLHVYTTIDLRKQRLATKAIAEVLNLPEDPASAIVTMNPANGYIEAMAESESYDKSQYNLAADGHRQPGSTFKAIDLADALSRGIDPTSTYYLSHTLAPGWLPGYPTYEVKTFEGTSLNKSLNLVSATLASDNTVYAQLAADLGEETVTQMAYQMGVKTHLSSYPAEALGGLTLGVTPLEMAIVYSTLADGGWRNSPIAITKVVFPDGHVDSDWGEPHRTKVLSTAITGEETSILHQNVLAGTGVNSAINCPTAAKTGTTSELVDAWLDGFNSRYATIVWMGYPNRRVSMTDVHGAPQQGAALPSTIWRTYMSAVIEGQPCAPLNEDSSGIEYKPFYGKYASTGQAQAGSEEEPRQGKPSKHKAAKPKRERAPIEVQETPAPRPTGPPPLPPGQAKKTGGAEPE